MKGNFLTTGMVVGAIVAIMSPLNAQTLGIPRGDSPHCGSTIYARFKTPNFYINICGNRSGPTLFVGTRNGGEEIVLPISSYSGGRYVMMNGNVRYVLTPSTLIVTQGGRKIVKERVIYWTSIDR